MTSSELLAEQNKKRAAIIKEIKWLGSQPNTEDHVARLSEQALLIVKFDDDNASLYFPA